MPQIYRRQILLSLSQTKEIPTSTENINMAELEELFFRLQPNMAWATNFVTAIYTADTEDGAAALLNSFLSDKAVIVVDGIETSRADFINQTKQSDLLRASTSVKFSDSVAAPGNPSLGDRVIPPSHLFGSEAANCCSIAGKYVS